MLLLCLITGAEKVKAQNNLVLKLKGEASQSADLSTLQKITFQNNSLFMNYKDGSTASFELANIEKIVFGSSGGTSTGSIKADETRLNIYPNPAVDVIYLKNLKEEGSSLSIYSLDGKLVMKTGPVYGEGPINIGSLSQGFYLLKVNNQTLKFNKL